MKDELRFYKSKIEQLQNKLKLSEEYLKHLYNDDKKDLQLIEIVFAEIEINTSTIFDLTFEDAISTKSADTIIKEIRESRYKHE